MEKKKVLLAVYGTLKGRVKGRLITAGLTKEKFILTASGIPYAVPEEFDPERARPIYAEVWEIDEEMLPYYDRYEGHPDWYLRKEVTIYGFDGKTYKAGLYTYPHREALRHDTVQVEKSNGIEYYNY